MKRIIEKHLASILLEQQSLDPYKSSARELETRKTRRQASANDFAPPYPFAPGIPMFYVQRNEIFLGGNRWRLTGFTFYSLKDGATLKTVTLAIPVDYPDTPFSGTVPVETILMTLPGSDFGTVALVHKQWRQTIPACTGPPFPQFVSQQPEMLIYVAVFSPFALLGKSQRNVDGGKIFSILSSSDHFFSANRSTDKIWVHRDEGLLTGEYSDFSCTFGRFHHRRKFFLDRYGLTGQLEATLGPYFEATLDWNSPDGTQRRFIVFAIAGNSRFLLQIALREFTGGFETTKNRIVRPQDFDGSFGSETIISSSPNNASGPGEGLEYVGGNRKSGGPEVVTRWQRPTGVDFLVMMEPTGAIAQRETGAFDIALDASDEFFLLRGRKMWVSGFPQSRAMDVDTAAFSAVDAIDSIPTSDFWKRVIHFAQKAANG